MADVKISALPPASVVNNADIVVLNQGGTTKTATKELVVAGLATTAQISGIATTAQLSAFQNSAQVQALASAQIAAITPASIGALSTDAASGFATTDQISGFTNSAQVQSLASAQIAAITPASIGAFATSAIIAISNGGTGATDAVSALANLGGITSAQVPAFDSAQLSAYVLKSGSTMDGRLIMAATTAQAKANIGGALPGVAAPSSSIAGDVWVSNQSRLTFSPSTGVAVALAGTSQANTFNQTQTIGVGGTASSLVVSNNGTGRAATFTAASTAAAVAITQTGVGEAFRVEDETSPDTTAFVISATGRVGIGVTPDAVTALAVDSGGIKFGDGSIATTAFGGVTTAQVSAIASEQIAAITPASIGAFETSATIGIENGGTGAITANDALTNLGAIPTSQQAGADLSGPLTAPNVVKLYGSPISQVPPTGGQVLRWSGTEWEPTNGGNGTVTSITVGSELMVDGIPGGTLTESGTIGLSGTGFPAGSYGSSTQVAAITFNGFGQITSASNEAITPAGIGAMSEAQAAGGDLSGNLPNPTVAKLQGISVTNATPLDGQVLQYDTATSSWVAGAIPSGGSGGGGQVFFFNYNTAADAPTTGLPTTPTTVKELGRVSDGTGTSYTSGTLSTVGYDLIVHFVTDVIDPNVTAIPAGLFDFNFWASSTGTTTNQTIIQLKVFKYNGTTATLLATSDDIAIYDPSVTAQYIASVVLPQTTISASDRLYIQFLGKAAQNNRTITLNFGAAQPSHVHTTIPSVGGSGLVKVINGVFQSPASKLLNEDVATNAAISLSKLAMSEVSVATGAGLTGGGDLSASRTLSIAALSPDPTGTYGSTSQIPSLTVNNLGQVTAASSLAMPSTVVEVFSTPGTFTWTKPAGAKQVVVELVSGGNGGGAGGKGTSGTAIFGGTGGGAGGYSRTLISASELEATCSVVVGTAGSGSIFGGAVATQGGASSFANTSTPTQFLARAQSGGTPGQNGGTVAGTAGSGGAPNSNAGGAASATATAGAGSGSANAPTGGGGGGGVSTGGAPFNGGNGATNPFINVFSAAGGQSTVANGGNGVPAATRAINGLVMNGGGGGGGGASSFATGSGGNGASGSGHGSGGGGGGATIGSGNGGNGGNGAPGIVVVTTYF